MRILRALVLVAGIVGSAPAFAAGDLPPVPDAGFSFNRTFGTYDRAAAQRGFQVYKEVCSACHSMRQLSYRNLTELGLSPDQVRNIAAGFQVIDGPNDEGQMFERPARLSDRFRRPFPNDQAARAANGGALPPDLSVITKARVGGANYIHALLTGYTAPPAGVTVMEGMHYNAYFPGHQIAMAAPLSDGQVDFGGGAPNTVDAMSRDLSTFLAWAAEPEMEERRALGVKILIFLAILGVLAYLTKRKIWADAH